MRQSYVLINIDTGNALFYATNFKTLQKIVRHLNNGNYPRRYKVIMTQNYEQPITGGNMKVKNYYKEQLKRLKEKWPYALTLKIIDSEGNETNWFNLNKESIPIVIKYIQNLKVVN